MIYDRDTATHILEDHLAHWQRQAAYYAHAVAGLTGMERPRFADTMRASLADARHQAAALAAMVERRRECVA